MINVNPIAGALVFLMLGSTLALGQSEKPPASGKEKATISGRTKTVAGPTARDFNDPSRITSLRLYCTPDGNSHFQNMKGELRKTNFAPPAAPLYIGDSIPASAAFFGGFEAGWGTHDLATRLYHPTPAVQSFIVLKGRFSITATDGETRHFQPGDVLRLEDTAPCKGHITVVGDKPGFAMFVR